MKSSANRFAFSFEIRSLMKISILTGLMKQELFFQAIFYVDVT